MATFPAIEHRPDIFWPLLLYWWSDLEGAWSLRIKTRLQRVHRRRRAYEFMDTEDRIFFDGLPEQVTVHRGFVHGHQLGISWTTDLVKAKWFARRFCVGSQRPAVATDIIRKSDVWAVVTGRGESEVLCHPKKVGECRILLSPRRS